MRFDWIKNQKEKALHILTFALAALTFLYIFTNYSLSFHADSAAVNILAREQMRTREFFPDTWNSATGIWLVFYNLFIIPLKISLCSGVLRLQLPCWESYCCFDIFPENCCIQASI